MRALHVGEAATRLAIAAAMLVFWGCSECENSTDCPIGQVCRGGECVPNPTPDSGTDTGVDADAPDLVDPVDDDVPMDPPTDDGVGPDTDALDPPTDDGTDTIVDADAESDGRCETNEECDDGNICTEDECNLSFHMCSNLPRDGEGCDDGDLCNGIGVCNEVGDCVINSSPLCEDHNECTFDTCVDTGEIVCTYDSTVMEGTTCDNSLYCDGTNDVCTGGFCMPLDPSFDACNDDNLCTFDTCTEGATGPECTHEDVASFQGITCGATATGVTTGSGETTTYGTCSGTLGTGPETVLVFGHDEDVDVTFTLVADPVSTAENNEMFLLTDGCDVSTCVDSGTPSVSITGVTAGTSVYVVVESVAGGAYYAVQADCS